jgi:hypothetical protein
MTLEKATENIIGLIPVAVATGLTLKVIEKINLDDLEPTKKKKNIFEM